MRLRRGRRDRRCFRQGRRAVPGIRRYLLCLRNDASDTDSDSIPLSSLLDDADNTEEALLSQTNSDVRSINPAVCTGLMQVKQRCLLHSSQSVIWLLGMQASIFDTCPKPG